MLAITSSCFQIHLCKMYKYKMEVILGSFTEWYYFIFRVLYFLFCFFQQPAFPSINPFLCLFQVHISSYWMMTERLIVISISIFPSFQNNKLLLLFSEQMTTQNNNSTPNCHVQSSAILRLTVHSGMWAEGLQPGSGKHTQKTTGNHTWLYLLHCLYLTSGGNEELHQSWVMLWFWK